MSQQDRKKTRTSTLLAKLFKAPDLERFIKNNIDDSTIPKFHFYITEFCRQSGYIPEQIINKAAIDRTYGHQLFNGTRKPSRDKVIQLAFGLGMDVENTQKLLKLAQKNVLYPKIKRDAAILYCLHNKMDILEAQNVLQTLGQTLLGGEEKNG